MGLRDADRMSARYLLVSGILVVLLAVLATLQYRWLGDVSAAERERLRATLRARADGFTAEFDHTIAALFEAFRLDPGDVDRDPAAALASAYVRAAQVPGGAALIARVYFVDGRAAVPLRALDPARRELAPAGWPRELEGWRRTLEIAPGATPDFPLLFARAVDAGAPALIVHVPRAAAVDNLTPVRPADLPTIVRVVVVLLARDALRDRLIAPLAARHFGSGSGADYLASIVRRTDPVDVIYSSPSAPVVDAATADIAVPLFAIRPDAAGLRDAAFAAVAEKSQRVAITIIRRGADPMHVVARADENSWTLLLRSRAGSLDALVARSRRRNIATTAGVLGLLGVSFVLVILSAERQRRLARQQMEFVAAVSHELRTPLAVICSAGENLADGLVADRGQVKQYGALVQNEGRRLADMVERVMEFAGIRAAGPRRAEVAVDVRAVVASATRALEDEARRRGIDIRIATEASLPVVSGDPDTLRSAVQNVVGNAVKYSADGASIDVAIEEIGSSVAVRVADCGIGIDADDLPHIFEPFFRGRRAIDRQVRGTGVGLAIVRQVVAAHRGDVHVASTTAGTEVTIRLPVRRATERRQPQVSHAS